MNKTELVAAIAKKTELSKKDAEKALKAFTDAVKKLLEEKPETFDPKKLGVVAMEAVKEQVIARMKMCGCDGKAK